MARRELTQITAGEIAAALEQDPEHELMELYARSLRDLGTHVSQQHGGRFSTVVDVADGSAVGLAIRSASGIASPTARPTTSSRSRSCKRAQIAAADLARAGVAVWHDLDQLTTFADNLVPHVLRLDGILRFEPELVTRIDAEELIEHGSPEEVEIRACAVHAVELLVADRPGSCAAEIDQLLWYRGGDPRYKAAPRHRSRCTAY